MIAQWFSSSPPPSPEAVWSAAFEEVCERIGPVFARSETRERAQAYLRGSTPSGGTQKWLADRRRGRRDDAICDAVPAGSGALGERAHAGYPAGIRLRAAWGCPGRAGD